MTAWGEASANGWVVKEILVSLNSKTAMPSKRPCVSLPGHSPYMLCVTLSCSHMVMHLQSKLACSLEPLVHEWVFHTLSCGLNQWFFI